MEQKKLRKPETLQPQRVAAWEALGWRLLWARPKDWETETEVEELTAVPGRTAAMMVGHGAGK